MKQNRSPLVVVVAAALLCGSPGRLGAEDPVAAAEKAAAASAATPEGKKFEEAVAEAFGRDQATNIQACAKEVKRPDLSDFHLFIQVRGSGRVEQAQVKPGTNLAVCLQGKVKGWKAGIPPQADAWVSVHVRLQAK